MADPEPMEKSNIYIEKRPEDCRAAYLVPTRSSSRLEPVKSVIGAPLAL